MALLIAVENQKGGCGKTTTAMNVAGGMQKAGYRVLVIDADPQASATIWSVAQGQGSLPFEVHTARQYRGNFRQLAKNEEFDIVLIDCPPGVVDDTSEAGKNARAAVREADAILVPLRPSTLDFSAAATFVRWLQKERQPDQHVMVLLNGRRNTLLDRQARDKAEDLFAPIEGAVVLDSTVGLRIRITEVAGSGQTIFDYAPSDDSAREYKALIKEIIQCLGQTSQPSTSATSQPSTSRSKVAATAA